MRSIWMKMAAVHCMVILGAGVFAGDQPDATALKIEQPPALDGKLDELFWKDAEPLGDFYIHKDPDKRRVSDTEVRLAYDDTWLYIGLKCDNLLQDLVMEPKTKDHDGPVHTDESVELFFDSDGAGKVYYHFMLSCFNVKAEQRFVNRQRQRETWNLPWRSATEIAAKGWTAEIAIPLYLFIEHGDLENIRLNICRSRREPFMDEQKVITHETLHHSSWQPVVRTFHEHRSFGTLAPLTPGKLHVPFLASLEQIAVKPYFTRDGENHYAIEVEVRGANMQSGELELVVTDQPVSGDPRVLKRQFKQVGTAVTRQVFEMPAPMPVERAVAVELRDATRNETFQVRRIENPAVLKIMDAWVDRNYYTTEEEAVAMAEIAMPAESIRGMRVAVELAGKAVADAPAAGETKISFSIKGVAVGRHPVKIVLMRVDGAPFFSINTELVRRTPNPGLAWKIDQINRVVLKPDGEPIFPFGPVMYGITPEDAADFQKIADAGCNTFFQWHRHLAATNANAFLETAQKHGLYVISQLETGWMPYRDADLKLPGKLLPPADAKKITNAWRTGSASLRGQLMSAGGTHPNKTAVFGEYFDKNVPLTRAVIESVKAYPNLMAYNTFDEPCDNRFFHITKYLDQFYGLTHETDGYHPVMLLYSSHIPEGDEYLTGGDILCTDPYWIPGGDVSRAGRNTPNFVSKIVYWNDQRARKFRQPVWNVPLGWEWSGCRKRTITGPEQDCQNFLAIIHGARGLFWFRYPMQEVGWENLKAAIAKVKVIGPMAVQPVVRQNIKHLWATAPETEFKEAAFIPERDEFPDVQGRIFREPEGDGRVLIAANSRYYPVTATFTVAGLAGAVERVFADMTLPVQEGVFTEQLEPFAVRAYRLGNELTEPAMLTIASLRPEKIPPPETAWANNVRPGRKNVLPNPSFEEETIPGIPDYYFGEGKTVQENGLAKFGAKCLQMINDKQKGYTQVYWKCAPQYDKETPCVLSFWAKGAEGGERLWARIRQGEQKTFFLTSEWARYMVEGTVPPRLWLQLELRLSKPGMVWVDGVQLEEGYEMTEFEE